MNGKNIMFKLISPNTVTLLQVLQYILTNILYHYMYCISSNTSNINHKNTLILKKTVAKIRKRWLYLFNSPNPESVR